MAALFGINRLKKLADEIPTHKIKAHIETVRRWHRDYHHGSLLADNETAREQAYNQDFFLGILGYTAKPGSPYTFEPKPSTLSGQIPDARIGMFGPVENPDDTVAVVELKGAKVQLDRPQRGHGNLSPVQQGFKYRPLYRGCTFVIISNFWELRLYNDNQLDYESWTLDDLVDPSNDYRRFKTFYLLLHAKNLLRIEGRSKTHGYLSDIRVAQDTIGRDFYEKYREARTRLLKSVWLRNESLHDDPDKWIEKSQKIVDRIVFACFAEDRGLLPDDTLHRIRMSASSSPVSVWATLKAFFQGIDSGDRRLGIPVGYNGGLFARDDELDALDVSDNALHGVLALGDYNFEEDLSVNILGHIFEQSISDLESIRGQVNAGMAPEKIETQRRRNEGIYYTPEHIVRYIVDHTLGARLREIESGLLERHRLHGDINESNYAKRENAAYVEYRNALEAVRVVDPACGSGAFLVQAFDFLIAEHRRVAAILDDIYLSNHFVASVLQNNLFGVDLNEESVEITKLSLWLKTAAKGEKLTSLDNNIKAGNSVKVSDGPGNGRSFRWHEEYRQIFDAGGFDVVIGNPPYVREAINRRAFDGLRDNPVFQGKMDIWTMFGNLAIDIVKVDDGRIGFIAPSNWITNAGASKFRDRLVQDARIEDYVDFGDYMVFDDASIQTMIFTLRRTNGNEVYSFPYARLKCRDINSPDLLGFLSGATDDRFERYQVTVRKNQAAGSTLNMNPESVDELLGDIERAGILRLVGNEVSTGIDVHQDFLNVKGASALNIPAGSGIFVLSEPEYQALNLNAEEKKLVKPYYTTSELHRYFGTSDHRHWVIYTNSAHRTEAAMAGLPHLKAHLDRFKRVITSDNAPYGLHRARDESFFLGEHIISLRKCTRPSFTYTDFDAFVSQTFFVIKTDRWRLKALTAILNSALVAFWLRRRGKMQGGQYQIDKEPLLKIPLVIPEDQSALERQTELIIESRRELAAVQGRMIDALTGSSRDWMMRQEAWWTKRNSELAESMGPAMPATRKADLLALIDDKRTDAKRFAEVIRTSEGTVDQIVYDLYGLTSAQVSVIQSTIPRAELVY